MGESDAATVTVRPRGIQFPAAPGQSIMAAATAAGYRWPTICGGLGDCLVCHVEVLEHADHLDEPADNETQAVRELRARSGRPVRLACQATVRGDVVVHKRGVRGQHTGERGTTVTAEPLPPVIDPHVVEAVDGGVRLRGGRCAACGDHHFPAASSCPRCGSADITVSRLATRGVLWSWTVQRFPPPSPPHVRSGDFEPFGLGYVELPGELIVESLLTESDPARLRIGMPMQLVAVHVPVENGATATTFAFSPLNGDL
ncbi:OB-fold domain-containing protein [Nocardia yamanashiensis]|uniref:OB-fold domain-containing protein n=1 Tax=Nocardia yamanashiensis TaxID=209247 RepID=UPI000AA43525|nr:OB-fold domain-containing protein [Nocardia yamanashiensis]